MAKDYYNTLGISRNASQEEIKKAYRKLAHQHHPDKKGGSDDRFKEVNEAYQVLSDPKKKTNYDNFGFAYNDGGFQGAGGGQGFGGFSDFFNGMGGQGGGGQQGGFEDIFEAFSDLFGGGGYAQPSSYNEEKKGEDLYLEVSIKKKDLGTSKIFEYKSFDVCSDCKGNGVEKGYKMVNCGTCHGTGQLKQSVRSGFGIFTRVGVCPHCKGKRKMPEKSCTQCDGQGRVKAKRKFEVHIPNDIENDYTVIVPKQGNAGRAGKPPGDLIINIKLKSSGYFK
jgi:molecular chaperone DnaJ